MSGFNFLNARTQCKNRNGILYKFIFRQGQRVGFSSHGIAISSQELETPPAGGCPQTTTCVPIPFRYFAKCIACRSAPPNSRRGSTKRTVLLLRSHRSFLVTENFARCFPEKTSFEDKTVEMLNEASNQNPHFATSIPYSS